jgi:hypothetical protein
MDRVSREFGDVEVRDPSGRPRRLREAWAVRTCVLLFVRQFG